MKFRPVVWYPPPKKLGQTGRNTPYAISPVADIGPRTLSEEMAGSQPNQANTPPWPLSAPESPVERRGANFNGGGGVVSLEGLMKALTPFLLSNSNASDFPNVCSLGADLSECGYERPPKLRIGP